MMCFGSAHNSLRAIFMWRKSDRHVEVFERLSVICAVSFQSFRRISRESPRGSTLVYVVDSSEIRFPFQRLFTLGTVLIFQRIAPKLK